VILHLLKTGLAQTWHDPIVNGINDLQELSKTHCQVTLARVRVWHNLRKHYTCYAKYKTPRPKSRGAGTARSPSRQAPLLSGPR